VPTSVGAGPFFLRGDAVNDDKPAFRFGTLTLAFAGLGDMEDLGPKYESHRASADCRVDGIVEVSVDGALPHLVPRDDFGVLREWSIDGSRLKIATGRWRAEVALERGAVSRVVMRRWRAWEFDLLMGCLVQVMAPVYDRGIVFHGSSVLGLAGDICSLRLLRPVSRLLLSFPKTRAIPSSRRK